ncbi:MAG: lipopolysaccharide biosynthesis protein [Bryobacteraceae bacterium]
MNSVISRPAVGREVAPPTLRRSFSWALAGNVVYAACQWAMLVVIAKLGSPEMVGQFALGIAVSSPVMLFTGLQLRAAQATDVRDEYAFGDYLGLRLIATVAGLVVIGGIGMASGLRQETAWVVLIVGLAKAADSVSDLIYGLFQRKERMDLVARSMIVRGVGSLAALTGAVWGTGSVVWGTAALAVFWAVAVMGFDLPTARRVLRQASGQTVSLLPNWNPGSLWLLTRQTLPLGFVMMLIALDRNMPRYFIEHSLGERELGIFAAIAYIQVAGTTVVDALCQSASPRLACLHAKGDHVKFRQLLIRLGMFSGLLGVAGVILASIAGRQILSFLYREEYAAESGVFLVLMAIAAVGYAGSVLGYGITATRRFSLFPLPYLLLTVAVALCSALAIPRWGLYGACAAAGVVSLGSCIVPFLILCRVREEKAYVTSEPATA